MPATTKQRTLVWAAVLVYLIYLVASHWHSLRHGMFSFPPFFGLMLLLLVIGVARNLYWPPPPRPLWVEVLVWAAISALVLYGSVFELRHPLGWDIDIWSVLMIVLIGVWGYSLLYPHGKLWRAFHPSEWGTGRENRRR